MFHDIRARVARPFDWFIRRNPMYLASAALMAIGARLFLVDPNTAPGEIKLILITLIVLQLYEWAVSAILLLLQRSRRSPEDKPSLLLIAMLFWTGPMAATIEMTVLRSGLGVILAIMACLMALAELGYIERTLQLRTSFPTKLTAVACVMYLALLPPMLRATDGAGPNELYLYGASWLLAVISLPAIATIRSNRNDLANPHTRSRASLDHEMLFSAITVGCTAIHTLGMNHAFFCHASWFYVSPLIVAASVVLGEYLQHVARNNGRLILLADVLPLLAIFLAVQDFNAHVPIHMLPPWLHKPLIPVTFICGIAWWYGWHRRRRAWLFHAGSAAFVFTAYRFLILPKAISSTLPLAGSDWLTQRNVIAMILFAAAAYMAASAFIRKNRHEAFAAMLLNFAAVSVVVWQRTPSDLLIMSIVIGWSWLAVMHLYLRRAPLLCRLVPIAFLAIATCASDFNPLTMWPVRWHSLVAVIALIVIGTRWRWTSYRMTAVGFGCVEVLCIASHWLGHISNPLALSVVLVSFLLLATGVIISWNKERLLKISRDTTTDNFASESIESE